MPRSHLGTTRRNSERPLDALGGWTAWFALLLAAALIGWPMTAFGQASFKRGDIDGNGCVNGSDYALWLQAFYEGVIPAGAPCQDAYDMDDNGLILVDLFDFVNGWFPAILDGFETLPAPGGVTCGPDPTPDFDSLTCTTYTGCAKECDPSACVEESFGGTVLLPPEGAACEYLTEDKLHMIIDGLPPGTDIEVGVVHKGFTNITRTPGGTFDHLGGEIETFDSTITLELQGTGVLSGFSRTIDLSAPTEVHTAPPIGTTERQLVEADMRSIQGSLPPGDPDFQSLTVIAGTANSGGVGALTSTGGTLLEQVGADYDVNSGFAIQYKIDFTGAPGGMLDGLTGSTEGDATMALPSAPMLVPSLSRSGIAILLTCMLLLAIYTRWRRHRGLGVLWPSF